MVNGRCPGCDLSIPVEPCMHRLYPFGMQSNVLYRSLNGNDFHIGVGSDVVCSTIIGNARASTRGMDNRTIPRFLCQIVANLMQDIKTI